LEVTSPATTTRPTGDAAAWRLPAWPFNGARGISAPLVILVLGIAALVLPTLFSLATIYWSTTNGAHGPILLVSGIWLLARERAGIRLAPRSISIAWLGFLLPPLLLLYAYARAFGILTLESAALYAALVLLAVYYWGPATVRRLWFAIAYLGFLVRPPAGLVAELTQPLKIWISDSAVSLLHIFDYPVASAGVRIQIGQYELLVQQACAGLGSIFSLFAICLLYVHLVRRADPLRSTLLLLAVIPVALGANYLRVVILILLTYHAGNNIGQGFAHDAAGLLTFVLSLLGMAAFDKLLMALPIGKKANG
jgi:exosortase